MGQAQRILRPGGRQGRNPTICNLNYGSPRLSVSSPDSRVWSRRCRHLLLFRPTPAASAPPSPARARLPHLFLAITITISSLYILNTTASANSSRLSLPRLWRARIRPPWNMIWSMVAEGGREEGIVARPGPGPGKPSSASWPTRGRRLTTRTPWSPLLHVRVSCIGGF
jgi:hypothetical protein